MYDFTIVDHSYEDGVQPEKITIPMKSHQLKLFKHCLGLESDGTEYRIKLRDAADAEDPIRGGHHLQRRMVSTDVGIIGNPVGSGKSLIMMAIMATPYHDLRQKKTYLEANCTMQVYYQIGPLKSTSVLVVPHTIFKQWVSYLQTQSALDVEYVCTKKQINNLQFNKEVILVSATMYNTFAEMVNEKNLVFARILFDEADSINIPRCIEIKSGFCWLVSSSVDNLLHPKGYKTQNTGIKGSGFIKDTCVRLGPYKSHIFLKNSDELIKESFNLPEPTCYYYWCKRTKVLTILENLISPDIQQMLCAGDVKGAIKASGVETVSDANLVSVVCEQLDFDVQNRKIDLESIKMKAYRDPEYKAQAIENCQKDIACLEQKIESVRTRIREANMDPITFCDIETPTIIRCCNQVFDFESVTIYIASTDTPKCPLCHAVITKESLIVVDENTAESESEPEPGSEPEIVGDAPFITTDHDKISNLRHLLTNVIASDSRIIIFSEYDPTFTAVEELLIDLEIPFKFLKGHGAAISNSLSWHEAESDTQKVLLLNARFAGCGLNIHWANDIVIYHKMNIELEAQIIGRSSRPPRTTSTNVHRLLYHDVET